MKTSPEAHQTETSFIAEHEPAIKELLKIAGVDTTNWSMVIARTQLWVRGDHFSPEQDINIPDEDAEHALGLFHSIGMVGEVLPPAGLYDRVLVLGGTHNSNNDRVAFVEKLLSSEVVALPTNAKVVLLGGNRTLGDSETPTPDISTETNSLRLVATQRLGELALTQMHLRVGLVPKTHDFVQRYEFRGEHNLVELINANPVERSNGQPRHTTRSTVTEWLRTDNLDDDAKVLFVSSNPYILRTLNDANSEIAKIGRRLYMFGCGPAASGTLLLRRCYGELARLIYQDNH